MFGFSDAVQATVEELLRAQKYGRLALVVGLALIQCYEARSVCVGTIFSVSGLC